MKTFDWDILKDSTNNRKYQWFVENFDNKNMTEERYVNEMKLLKGFSNCKTNKRRNSDYCPSNLKRDYRRLKNDFGFF
jgi:hypothetical protein